MKKLSISVRVGKGTKLRGLHMIVAKVCGSIVSTNKSDRMQGMKILLVRQVDIPSQKQVGEPKVAIDTIGAGEGEIVLCVAGSSSRQTSKTFEKPVDLAIIGIVDSIDLIGSRVFEKYESE